MRGNCIDLTNYKAITHLTMVITPEDKFTVALDTGKHYTQDTINCTPNIPADRTTFTTATRKQFYPISAPLENEGLGYQYPQLSLSLKWAKTNRRALLLTSQFTPPMSNSHKQKLLP